MNSTINHTYINYIYDLYKNQKDSFSNRELSYLELSKIFEYFSCIKLTEKYNTQFYNTEQEQKISLLRSRIQKNYNLIRTFQEQGQTEWFTKKISELGELNEEYQQTIDDIESEPEGDFPQELLDDEVERLVNNAKNNISSFMEDYGLNYEDYVEAAIRSVLQQTHQNFEIVIVDDHSKPTSSASSTPLDKGERKANTAASI